MTATLRVVRRLLDAALVAVLCAMVGVVVAGVWYRYVLGDPLIFSFDLSTLLFAWLVFLGIAAARIDGAHLGIDLVPARAPARLRAGIDIVREAVVLALSVYLAWQSLELTRRTGVQITSMRLSAKWLYAAMPAGFGLMAALTAGRLVLAVRRLARGAGDG